MSSSDNQRYIVSVTGGDKGLTELNELTNSFTRSGFELSITNKDGTLYELAPLTFTLNTSQSKDEVKNLAVSLSEQVLSEEPQIVILTIDEWLKNEEDGS